MNSEPEILEERELHRGWLHVVHRRIRHPGGGVQEYEIVNPGSHSVSVVALDCEEQIILVEMYRFGQHRRLKELPAGGVKAGESYPAAMRRELLEETGYEGEIEAVGSHFIGSEHGITRHVFVAKNCRKVAEPSLDASEKDEGAEVVLMSLGEFREHLRSGQLTETAAGYMGLDALGLL